MVLIGKIKRMIVRIDYSPSDLERDYAFGKFPKTKWEVLDGRIVIYFFTTTIRSDEECKVIISQKIKEKIKINGMIRVFKTVDGIRQQVNL